MNRSIAYALTKLPGVPNPLADDGIKWVPYGSDGFIPDIDDRATGVAMLEKLPRPWVLDRSEEHTSELQSH